MRQLVSCCLKGDQQPSEPQQTAWRARQTNVSGQVLWHVKVAETGASTDICSLRYAAACKLLPQRQPKTLGTPSPNLLKNSAETLRLHHAFDPSLHPGPVKPTEITNHQAIMSTNEKEQQESGSILEPKDSERQVRLHGPEPSSLLCSASVSEGFEPRRLAEFAQSTWPLRTAYLHLVCSDSTRTETRGTPEAHSFKLEAFGLAPTMYLE